MPKKTTTETKPKAARLGDMLTTTMDLMVLDTIKRLQIQTRRMSKHDMIRFYSDIIVSLKAQIKNMERDNEV